MNGKEILKSCEKLQKDLVEWRRLLHQNAEVGFELSATRQFILEKLRETGYKPTKCGKSGVVAEVGKSLKKRANEDVFLIRADMDGLPIKEETEESFACEKGRMHACGHDLHTAMLLGAAKVLKEREEELGGKIRLLFQPAEEILEGAKDCVKSGVLEDVKGALMLHVLTGLPLETGTVVISSQGVSAPAADFFTVRVKGKGCHGSSPQNGIDAALVAAQILLGLQTVVAREIPPSQTAALTVGKIVAGEAGNVIADSAELKGSMRAFDEDTRKFIKKRITEIVKGVAESYRAQADVTFTSGCPALYNDGEISSFAYGCAKELFGTKRVFTSDELNGGAKNESGGSEDFAYIAKEVPSVMIALCAGEKGKGYDYPLHHPKVRFDENALSVGAALYAYISSNFHS